MFNNNIKEITKQWFSECDPNSHYVWVDSSESYIADLSESESIELSQGGCYHYSWNLTYASTQINEFNNHTFWLSKAHELALKFQMTPFIEPLNKNEFHMQDSTDTFKQFMLLDNDYESTYITEGIIVQRKDSVVLLFLSYYIN